MITKYLQACLLVLTLCAAAPSHASVHKWVDAAGATHYAEAVPAGQAGAEVRLPLAPAPASAPAAGGTLALNSTDAVPAPSQCAARAAAARDEAATRAVRCAAARHDLQRLQSPERLSTPGPDGHMMDLEDGVRARLLDEAQRAAAANCK